MTRREAFLLGNEGVAVQSLSLRQFKWAYERDKMNESIKSIDIQIEELARLAPYRMIDIRTPEEVSLHPLGVSHDHIPMEQLLQIPDQIKAEETTVLVCAAGVRTKMTAEAFRKAGYMKVFSLVGGACIEITQSLRVGNAPLTSQQNCRYTLKMRWVSFLLLYCCIPMVPLYAAEETLEERRERIMRKYLRERTVVYESDLVVEENSQQDREQIEDSEMMLIEDTTFAKEEDMVPNRVRRPYVVPAQMRAAWMALEEETDADFEEESEDKERYEYQRYEKRMG